MWHPTPRAVLGMDPETLVTFLFKAPPDVRTVELLGSWDNFTHTYSMYHDRRRGPGFFTGCFKFRDIIFDGNEVNWSRPRSGGLKQGGTYWYYFRIDDEVEAYDDRRDCTSECPLMPGQTVNVIDVPREVVHSPVRGRSASVDDLAGTLTQLDALHTMNPNSKYNALSPPPVSKVHARCVSDLALNGRLENQAATIRPSVASRSPPRGRSGRRRSRPDTPGSLRRHGSSRSPAYTTRSLPTRSVPGTAPITRDAEATPRSMCSEEPRPQTRHADSGLGALNHGFHFGFSSPDPKVTHPQSPLAESIGGPRSVQDVQFVSDPLASSPPQARDDDQSHGHRRLYSLHNADLETRVSPAGNPVGSQTNSTSTTPPNGQVQASADPHALTLSSPTYSVATISTNDGLTTPFFTSSTYPNAATSHVNDKSVEDVTARLRHIEQDEADRPYPPNRSSFCQPSTYQPSGLPGLSLFPKVPQAHQQYTLPLLAAERGPEEQGGSVAEAIFSELGYLGGSIH